MIDILECEKSLDYQFNNKQLLLEAFTHASYANEHRKYKSNELLEFFGDSILGFIVSEFLFEKNKKGDEGKLTIERQQYVSRIPLSKAVISCGLDKFLLLSAGTQQEGARSKTSICENLFEAIVAAIYIDGGLDEAKKFIYDKLINNLKANQQADPKSILQEHVQMHRLGNLCYKEISRSGPPHKPTFLVALLLNEKELSRAESNSKQSAERKSAKIALKLLMDLKR